MAPLNVPFNFQWEEFKTISALGEIACACLEERAATKLLCAMAFVAEGSHHVHVEGKHQTYIVLTAF